MKNNYRSTWLPLLFFSASLFAEVSDVNPDQLQRMIAEQNTLVIDVRTPEEWRTTGTIPSSRTMMFYDQDGDSDPQQWLEQLMKIKIPGQRVVLVCHSGGRSAKVAEFLDQEAQISDVYNLEDGISSWIEKGKPTQPCDAGSC